MLAHGRDKGAKAQAIQCIRWNMVRIDMARIVLVNGKAQAAEVVTHLLDLLLIVGLGRHRDGNCLGSAGDITSSGSIAQISARDDRGPVVGGGGHDGEVVKSVGARDRNRVCGVDIQGWRTGLGGGGACLVDTGDANHKTAKTSVSKKNKVLEQGLATEPPSMSKKLPTVSVPENKGDTR